MRADRLIAILLLLQVHGQLTAAELAERLEAARRKVLAALPAPLREQAAVASRALLFDNTAWGAARRQAGGDPAGSGEAHLAVLRQAVLRRRQVVLVYEPPGRPAEERRAHPHGLVCKRGVWYLVAGTSNGQRTYRLSRVVSVRVTEEAADAQGRSRLVIGFPSSRHAAAELLGLSDDLEVVGPEEVRRAMVEAGRRLVDRYGGGGREGG